MAIVLQLPTGNRVAINANKVVIGTDASCDVTLPVEARIQPRHATLSSIAGRWLIQSEGDWLIQVGSGVPGRKCWVNPNDSIRLTESGPVIVFEPTAIGSQKPPTIVPQTSGPLNVPHNTTPPHSPQSSSLETPETPIDSESSEYEATSQSMDLEFSGKTHSSGNDLWGTIVGIVVVLVVVTLVTSVLVNVFANGMAYLTTKVTIEEFCDNPQAYKSKNVNFTREKYEMRFPIREIRRSAIESKEKSYSIAVGVYDKSVWLTVPTSLEVQDLDKHSYVDVTFRCTNGKADEGNILTKIARSR